MKFSKKPVLYILLGGVTICSTFLINDLIHTEPEAIQTKFSYDDQGSVFEGPSSNADAEIVSSDVGFAELFESGNEINVDELDSEGIALLSEYLLETKSSIDYTLKDLSFRNNMLEELMAREDCLDVAFNVLINGVTDKGQNSLWREYVLQHYSIFIQDYNGKVEPPYFEELLQVLVDSLKETENGIAGTALLNLGRLSEEVLEVEIDNDWSAFAAQIALDPRANIASRIPALQVLPVHSDQPPIIDVLQLKGIIQSANEHHMIKLAALNYATRASDLGHMDYSSVQYGAYTQKSHMITVVSSVDVIPSQTLTDISRDAQ